MMIIIAVDFLEPILDMRDLMYIFWYVYSATQNMPQDGYKSPIMQLFMKDKFTGYHVKLWGLLTQTIPGQKMAWRSMASQALLPWILENSSFRGPGCPPTLANTPAQLPTIWAPLLLRFMFKLWKVWDKNFSAFTYDKRDHISWILIGSQPWLKGSTHHAITHSHIISHCWSFQQSGYMFTLVIQNIFLEQSRNILDRPSVLGTLFLKMFWRQREDLQLRLCVTYIIVWLRFLLWLLYYSGL